MITFHRNKNPINSDLVKKYKGFKKKGILEDIFRFLPEFDEPQFYQFRCINSFKKNSSSGTNMNKNDAYCAAMYEAVEHYALYTYSNKVIKDSYNNLKNRAIDPFLFRVISDQQLKDPYFSHFIFDKDTPFRWVEGYSLTQKKKILIPLQLVSLSYCPDEHNEQYIRDPISTGTACGPNKDFALYRGICEIIERDAYMIRYLHNAPKSIIDITGDSELRKLKEKIERYNLTLHIVETTIDFPTTSVMAIITDSTGMGPAVCVGLGCSLNPISAIKSAIYETVMVRSVHLSNFFCDPLDISHLDDLNKELHRKYRLWSAPHMRKEIEKFLDAPTKSIKDLPDNSKKSDAENVAYILQNLQAKSYNIFVVDITPKILKNDNVVIMKVLIPQLYPVNHDERIPYKFNERLYNVLHTKENNSRNVTEEELHFSHPF